ncbi:hypothetical protein FNV43_RR19269 [Rhamnella rubrinervis]|uniref:SCP domain-containing protein n=1 Tax=Rhamnella rubrinervis TaxID=2594499 RepID=A0A8K0GX19_9ROSA|nr:hypothetical protein FNV43_RR17634 [Rhamnella rubrinervis]KAF3440983.1 hypothetical protein FNV43_RR19269 [Rhamnella rubrinervis]
MESLTLTKFSLSLCYCITVLIIFQTRHVHSFPRTNPNQDFVDAHNAARAEVGVGPITWNHTVAAYAQNYANQRVNNCEMEHSGGPYGENLAEGYESMTGEDAVKFWVTEKANYDYSTNSCVGDECLHYTQVVWRNSVHLGCARAKCRNDWMFVICNYDPPGNYEGERPY